jgi:hypothetical protein
METIMFLETTPDTSGYMIAGYTIALGVMAIYVASMIIRARNLNQDQELLESIGSESKPMPPLSQPKVRKEAKKPAASKPRPKTSVKKKK